MLPWVLSGVGPGWSCIALGGARWWGLGISGSGWLLHASCSKCPAPVWILPRWGLPRLVPTGPTLIANSSLQKDAPQTPWAATQGPVPPKAVGSSISEQPPSEEPAKSPLSTEETGAADPAKDPDSPVAGPLSPSNGDEAQPIPVVKPETSA